MSREASRRVSIEMLSREGWKGEGKGDFWLTRAKP